MAVRERPQFSTSPSTGTGESARELWRTGRFGPDCVERPTIPLASPPALGQSRSAMDSEGARAGPRAARVLIGEPFPEVRQLLERAVDHLGHEALTHEPGAAGPPLDVDVLVLEPSYEGGLALAQELRRENPGLSVICTCSETPGSDIRELAPVAYLVKPFALADLERALADAVRRSVTATTAAAESAR